MSNKKILKLKGKTAVFIDWANVYNWKKSLKGEVDPKKLHKYLSGYKEIEEIRFYFGKDKHKKSRKFLRDMRKVGYKVTTKPVKYILIAEVEDQKIYRRKCDFDMEICIDVHKALAERAESFVFFTGDGDFDPLYKLLIKMRKRVIVIYAHGHLGREIYQIKKGVYKCPIEKLGKSNLKG